MRILISAISFLIFFSCQTKESTQSKINDASVTDGEIFSEFFVKFTSDSVFQKERIKFPFISEVLDTDTEIPYYDTIAFSNWKFATFEYKSEYRTREIDAYTQEIRNYNDTVKVELRGVDNGIRIDFDFYKENGKWFWLERKITPTNSEHAQLSTTTHD